MLIIISFFIVLYLVSPFLFWALILAMLAYAIISALFVTTSAIAGSIISKPLKAGLFDDLKWWHCPLACLVFASIATGFAQMTGL